VKLAVRLQKRKEAETREMGSKLQNLKPLILSIALISLICIVAYARIQNQNIWEDSIANFNMVKINEADT
jgi:hypothetical protein